MGSQRGCSEALFRLKEEAPQGLIPNGIRPGWVATSNLVTAFLLVMGQFVGQAGFEPAPSSLSGFCTGVRFHRIPPASWANDVPLETVANRSGPMDVDQTWTKPGAEASCAVPSGRESVGLEGSWGRSPVIVKCRRSNGLGGQAALTSNARTG